MKILFNLAILALAPMMTFSAMGDSKPVAKPVAVVDECFPANQLVQGNAVRVQLDDGIADYHKRFDAAIAKMTNEEREALKKILKPGQPIPFDERLGVSKEDYAKYLEVWKKKKVVEVAPIVVGLQKTATPGVWKVASSSQQGPLPMSTLQYDANKNVWVSPNGELACKGVVSYDEMNNLGAWKGQEWLFQNKDSYSQIAENVLVGKTKDGKYVYMIYNIIEVTKDGKPTWNESLVLRFPTASLSGKDDLLNKAKKNAANK
ncbi:MAG: hypothetical protein RR250_04670 [Akkermansia sp.]